MKNISLMLLFFIMAGCAANTYVKTEDGVELIYDLKEIPGAKGTVVLLHGLGADMDSWYDLRGALHDDGWSTLAFDFRGHGMSRRWKGEELNWRGFDEVAMGSTYHDVETAVSLIDDSRPYWLIGASFGANMALRFASNHPEAQGAVLFSPGLDYAGVTAEPYIEQMRDRPLMLIAGGKDRYAADSVKKMAGSLGDRSEVKLYEEEQGHGEVMLELVPELEKEVLEWINRNTNLK